MTFFVCLVVVVADLVATVKVWEWLKPKHADQARIAALETELGMDESGFGSPMHAPRYESESDRSNATADSPATGPA